MSPSSAYGLKPSRAVAACIVPLLWMACSSGLILLNKHLMADKGFKYPIILSGLGQGFSAVAAFVCCRVLKIVPAEKPVDARFYLTRLMPIGLLVAMTLIFGNAVYMYLSVSLIQMLKAFTPVITMTGLFLAALEVPTVPLITSVLVIACGVAFAGYGAVAFSFVGFLVQLASETAEATRLVMTQKLLQGLAFHPIEGVMYIAPAAFVWMALGAAVYEAPLMLANGGLTVMRENALAFTAAATMGFTVVALTFFTIQLCGSLSYKVLGTVKNAALVIFCIVVLGEPVSPSQGAGYLVALTGFAWFQYIKSTAACATSKKGAVALQAASGGYKMRDHSSAMSTGSGPEDTLLGESEGSAGKSTGCTPRSGL